MDTMYLPFYMQNIRSHQMYIYEIQFERSSDDSIVSDYLCSINN